jgi:hypothetical protein
MAKNIDEIFSKLPKSRQKRIQARAAEITAQSFKLLKDKLSPDAKARAEITARTMLADLEARLVESLDSGEATPLIKKDFDALRKQVKHRASSKQGRSCK